MSFPSERLIHWTVDYGDDRDPRDIVVPHAWRQDVPVTFEGPVRYRTEVVVPRGPACLRFEGVCYQAEVFVAGEHVVTHCGAWDAFEVPLRGAAGDRVVVEVVVTKNGGERFPVRDVASGFLPYVYHTFGGIHGSVTLTAPSQDPIAHTPRVEIDGLKLRVDGKPFRVRGILHWGWYPELGHTNPPEDEIRKEVATVKTLGFNLIKFCLWVPSHRYLEILDEMGMFAWIELPLWNPNPDRLDAIAQEMEIIARQYRGHSNVIAWTIGCELGAATTAAFRARLTQLIRNITGCPLVKDDSGGAEMYGGDPREFGTFEDFHPYCDTPFYPPVLDELTTGPRTRKPILLGEFNDIDVHRDLAVLDDRLPYWASALSELNAQGVRWQYDLPRVLRSSRFVLEPRANRHAALMESSRRKALFMRKTVQEAVAARPIAGYVITGLRDTPISSAGFLDDWGQSRFRPEETSAWNGPDVLFLIPYRRPHWTHGGNRPGWMDPLNHFAGDVHWKIGVRTESTLQSGLSWQVIDDSGRVVASGAEPWISVTDEPTQVGEIAWFSAQPGAYTLVAEFGSARNSWPIWVCDRQSFSDVRLDDPTGRILDSKFGDGDRSIAVDPTHLESCTVGLLRDRFTRPAPFWRESAFEFAESGSPFADRWSRLLPVSTDRVIDLEAVRSATNLDVEVLVNRIDVRTYAEAPIMVRFGTTTLTTLRPEGGLGSQPSRLDDNPAGVALLSWLLK